MKLIKNPVTGTLLSFVLAAAFVRADTVYPNLNYYYRVRAAGGQNQIQYDYANSGYNFVYQTAPYSFAVSSASGVYPFGGNDQGSASASGRGTAAYGDLHAYSASLVNFAGNCMPLSGGGNTCQGWAYSGIEVGFGDVLTFSSSTLPAGTPVSYRVTATLDDRLSYTATDPSVANGCNPSIQGAELQTDIGTIWGSACHATSRTISQVLTSTVGGTALIVEYLYADSRADDQPGIGFDQATVNASDTARLFVQVLTPGATYSSASGTTYDASAPEPASLALLGVGLLGIGLFARNQLLKRKI